MKLADVEKILSPMDFSNEQRMAKFIAECQDGEWSDNPAKGKSIFVQLYGQAKIERYNPREKGYPLVEGNWAASEAEIQWSQGT